MNGSKEKVDLMVSNGKQDAGQSKLETQVIDDRYLDAEKLQQHLESNFPGQWRVQVVIFHQ